MTIKERYKKILDYFLEEKPVAETELMYSSPYELLVAVILSAQCADKRVNLITPPLFARYPNPYELAKATQEEIYTFIKSCSYPNNKAKHLSGMAKILIEEFDGEVPNNVEQLKKLPGVGQKTANVIASVVYDLPYIAVDTHVFRVSERIGLTKGSKTPNQTEAQLVKYIPEELRALAHHWLILHGRYVCMARKPKCFECGIKAFCRYFNEKSKTKDIK